jgi:hypothetical protein
VADVVPFVAVEESQNVVGVVHARDAEDVVCVKPLVALVSEELVHQKEVDGRRCVPWGWWPQVASGNMRVGDSKLCGWLVDGLTVVVVFVVRFFWAEKDWLFLFANMAEVQDRADDVVGKLDVARLVGTQPHTSSVFGSAESGSKRISR